MSLDAPTLADLARSTAASTLPGPACSVRKEQARHPRGAEIAEVIMDRTIGATVAATIFRDAGIDLSRFTIERHRANQCVNCLRAGTLW